MHRDPRGGHNRKQINENFFKYWSPQMSYVLGLIFADGAIEDVRKSSRTCYLAITSKDKSLLEKIKKSLSSSHKLYIRKPRIVTFSHGESYLCSKTFTLRIGNKTMFSDLVNLGLTPRKSLTISLPEIPEQYFGHFLRGYFDGDGCVTTGIPKGRKTAEIQTIFISGSRKFLESLSLKLKDLLFIKTKNIFSKDNSHYLRYRGKESLRILHFMYKNLVNTPYLERKYKIYYTFLGNLSSQGEYSRLPHLSQNKAIISSWPKKKLSKRQFSSFY
ncbi:MAG: intein-containing protein [Candidatus Woesebacteria bacterium GW2011_GWB1_40_101]|uniref:Intein-containing protein n=1 Tax=Candidatus Woesebacteria bacterium GW2011_GWB1_40_101 TaxID=1618575 RepID=A0A0G0SXH4_9BACT|nr:MAG: intein-containing protein [Candidatus Woesebacteria bacterium GW2011_GWB1_40_101]